MEKQFRKSFDKTPKIDKTPKNSKIGVSKIKFEINLHLKLNEIFNKGVPLAYCYSDKKLVFYMLDLIIHFNVNAPVN